MLTRKILAVFLMMTSSAAIAAEVAQHTMVTRDLNGIVREYTEMAADDAGNLRYDMFDATADGGPGELRDWVVWQAAEQTMVMSDGNRCERMKMDGSEMPGMPQGIDRQEMMAAQAEMQRAMQQMAAENPEMARMMEQRLANSGLGQMMGGEKVEVEIVEIGQTREVGDYDTKGFQVVGGPATMGDTTVWATDIDDVDGGRIIGNASTGMMRAQQQMMDNMGVSQFIDTNVFGEIMEKMSDYYPVMTEDSRGITQLVSTSGSGEVDFYPDCN